MNSSELCTKCHGQYRGAEAVRRTPSRSSWRRCGVHQLSHAEEEHGARVQPDAVPPRRFTDRENPGRKRSPARVRALSRGQERRRASVDDGALLEQELRSRAPDCALRRSSAPVLESTLARGKAHEQATALHVLGEHKVKRAMPLVAAQLLNRYPLVRYFAREALEKCRVAPAASTSTRKTPSSKPTPAAGWKGRGCDGSVLRGPADRPVQRMTQRKTSAHHLAMNRRSVPNRSWRVPGWSPSAHQRRPMSRHNTMYRTHHQPPSSLSQPCRRNAASRELIHAPRVALGGARAAFARWRRWLRVPQPTAPSRPPSGM